jgi:hypothetical protein
MTSFAMAAACYITSLYFGNVLGNNFIKLCFLLVEGAILQILLTYIVDRKSVIWAMNAGVQMMRRKAA